MQPVVSRGQVDRDAAAAHSIAMTAAADFAVAASSRDVQLIQAQPI